MEGEEVSFWLFLFDLEGLDPLPTYPQVESKSSSSLKKLFLWVKLFLEFLKIVFKKGKEAPRHERK